MAWVRTYTIDRAHQDQEPLNLAKQTSRPRNQPSQVYGKAQPTSSLDSQLMVGHRANCALPSHQSLHPATMSTPGSNHPRIPFLCIVKDSHAQAHRPRHTPRTKPHAVFIAKLNHPEETSRASSSHRCLNEPCCADPANTTAHQRKKAQPLATVPRTQPHIGTTHWEICLAQG